MALTYKVYLAEGTYTLRLYARKSATAGIVDIYFDAAEVASFDQYDAVLTLNQIFTQTGITVASGGMVDMQCIVDGKHGSSSGHISFYTAIALWRTA